MNIRARVSGTDLSTGTHLYYYDAIGNLTQDVAEGLSQINWTLTNKVQQIQKTGGDEINFKYDALGNRTQKSSEVSSSTNKTYYIRDAQGNTMATYYQAHGQSTASLTETNIFGSSRAGVLNYYASNSTSTIGTKYSRKLSNKHYELSNHLGNVLAVISDAPILENQDLMLHEWDFSDGTTSGWTNGGTTSISNFEEKLLVTTTTTHGNTYQLQNLTAGNYTFQIELGNYTESGANPYPPEIRMTVQDITSGTSTLANFVTSGQGINSVSFTVTGSGSRSIRMMVPVPGYQRTQAYHYTIDNVRLTEDDATVYTEADVLSYQDYYPGGMIMPNRSYTSSDDYRYGFNSMEKDDEIKGSGNSYDFGARIYDPRTNRWLSLDPLAREYPSLSDYSFVANNPIFYIDPTGEKIVVPNVDDREPILKMINSKSQGVFAFNEAGELYLVKSTNTEGFSDYYENRLVEAINDDQTITVEINERVERTRNREDGTIERVGEKRQSVDELGGGVTQGARDKDQLVTISGNDNTTAANDTEGKPLEQKPADILMHELLGHAIPFAVGSDTGNSVENENKARKEIQNGKPDTKIRADELEHVE